MPQNIHFFFLPPSLGLHVGFPCIPGGAKSFGTPFTPSFLSFSSVFCLLNSITLLCLKYVTCWYPVISHVSRIVISNPCCAKNPPNLSPPLPLPLPPSLFFLKFHENPNLIWGQKDGGSRQDVVKGKKIHTQLFAHSFSKSLDCSPHCRCDVSASLMLSIIEFCSRHSKNASRACQQWARAFRLGASKAPSVEGLGLSTVLLTAAGLGEAERRPIW